MKQFQLPSDIKIFDGCILPPNVYEAILEAQEIIENAKQDARQIVANAEEEKLFIVQQGHYTAQGNLASLQEDLKQQFEEAKAAVVSEMYRNMDNFLLRFQQGIPFLVENILYRIIGEFHEEELLARCIAMGIEEMRDAAEMIIRVHPNDAGFLEKMLDPWLRKGTGAGYVRLETDNFIPEKECIIITEIGTIELSVEKQLQAFTDSLKAQFGSENRGGDD